METYTLSIVRTREAPAGQAGADSMEYIRDTTLEGAEAFAKEYFQRMKALPTDLA